MERDFIISGEQQVKQFVNALELSAKDAPVQTSVSAKQIHGESELREFMQHRQQIDVTEKKGDNMSEITRQLEDAVQKGRELQAKETAIRLYEMGMDPKNIVKAIAVDRAVVIPWLEEYEEALCQEARRKEYEEIKRTAREEGEEQVAKVCRYFLAKGEREKLQEVIEDIMRDPEKRHQKLMALLSKIEEEQK